MPCTQHAGRHLAGAADRCADVFRVCQVHLDHAHAPRRIRRQRSNIHGGVQEGLAACSAPCRRAHFGCRVHLQQRTQDTRSKAPGRARQEDLRTWPAGVRVITQAVRPISLTQLSGPRNTAKQIIAD